MPQHIRAAWVTMEVKVCEAESANRMSAPLPVQRDLQQQSHSSAVLFSADTLKQQIILQMARMILRTGGTTKQMLSPYIPAALS